MSLHDAYARRTPFELAFRDRESADALVRAVEEESAGRGADHGSLDAFVTMGAVESFVRDLAGPDAPAGAIREYGALAFQAFHFTRIGCPLFLLSTHVARFLVEGAPDGDPVPAESAGYLQFPRHLFWVRQGEGEPPESVDGVFWTATDADFLHSLIVTGVRPDRPGLGIVPLPAAPLAESREWLDVDARGDGTDFSNDMPGGEIDVLYAFTTSGELLKLLARFFAYVQTVPSALEERPGSRDDRRGGGAEDPVDDPEAGDRLEAVGKPRAGDDAVPEPSALPFIRVTLDG